jgi:hypothetical protein
VKSLYQTLKEINDYTSDKTQCPKGHDFSINKANDTLATCLLCAYAIRQKAFKVNEKGKWQRLWLKHCISQETNYIFHVLKEVDDKDNPISVNREEDVRKIIDEGLMKEDAPLSQYILSRNGVKYYKDVLMDWFLKRYNWREALLLYSNKSKSLIPKLGLTVIIILNVLFFLFLTGDVNLTPSFHKGPPFLFTEYQVTAGSSGIKDIKDVIDSVKTDIHLLIAEGISFILLFLFGLFSMFDYKTAKLLFPRLFGAIFIGLIPLITLDIAWMSPLRLNWGQIGFISLLAFIMAFLYLTVECRKITLLLTWWEAIKRTLLISLYGLLISIFLSLIACDIIAIHFIDYKSIFYPEGFVGFFGIIYPKVVVLFAFASFLLGIFIQIFWEEETITQPL